MIVLFSFFVPNVPSPLFNFFNNFLGILTLPWSSWFSYWINPNNVTASTIVAFFLVSFNALLLFYMVKGIRWFYHWDMIDAIYKLLPSIRAFLSVPLKERGQRILSAPLEKQVAALILFVGMIAYYTLPYDAWSFFQTPFLDWFHTVKNYLDNEHPAAFAFFRFWKWGSLPNFIFLLLNATIFYTAIKVAKLLINQKNYSVFGLSAALPFVWIAFIAEMSWLRCPGLFSCSVSDYAFYVTIPLLYLLGSQAMNLFSFLLPIYLLTATALIYQGGALAERYYRRTKTGSGHEDSHDSSSQQS